MTEKKKIIVNVSKEGYVLQNPEDVIENNKDKIAHLAEFAEEEKNHNQKLKEYKEYFTQMLDEMQAR